MMSGKGNKRYGRNSQKKENKIRQRVKMGDHHRGRKRKDEAIKQKGRVDKREGDKENPEKIRRKVTRRERQREKKGRHETAH